MSRKVKLDKKEGFYRVKLYEEEYFSQGSYKAWGEPKVKKFVGRPAAIKCIFDWMDEKDK